MFVPQVRAEYEPIVHAKLKMARDLLISCIIDHRKGEDAYGYLREEIVEISRANRSQGKTNVIMSIAHPISTANVMRSLGVTNGVHEVISQVNRFTYGHKPGDFEYIAEVPTKTKGAKYNEQVEALLAQQAKGKGTNFRTLEFGLRQKLQDCTIQQQDVAIALQVASAIGSLSSRVLYANVKRAAEQAQETQQTE